MVIGWQLLNILMNPAYGITLVGQARFPHLVCCCRVTTVPFQNLSVIAAQANAKLIVLSCNRRST